MGTAVDQVLSEIHPQVRELYREMEIYFGVFDLGEEVGNTVDGFLARQFGQGLGDWRAAWGEATQLPMIGYGILAVLLEKVRGFREGIDRHVAESWAQPEPVVRMPVGEKHSIDRLAEAVRVPPELCRVGGEELPIDEDQLVRTLDDV